MGELDPWRHCPRCGAAVTPLDSGARIECGECGLRHYASAKPAASALLLDDDGRILLARRAHDPDAGKWDLPGGFLDESEHPRDALVRELREETSLEVEPVGLFDIVIDRYGDGDDASHTLNLYWVCRVVRGDATPADDVTELRWFAPADLPPPAELAFRCNAQVLAAWRKQHA